MTFTQWLNALVALIGLDAVTALLADSDICGALRLWHRSGWSVSDAAAALKDQDLGND